MGVVLGRCTKCERVWKIVVFQARGKRLRNRPSPCCAKRMRKASYDRPASARPDGPSSSQARLPMKGHEPRRGP